MPTEYKKISQLPAVESLRGTDQFEIEREGTSKSITGNDIKDFANSGLIDDAHSGSQSTYSSGLIDQKLDLKQNSTDNSLATTDKTIVGAINENKSVIGYSYDEYDATTAYATGDLCIYNNTLYKALQATTGNLPTNTTYWEQTSIAVEIGRIDTALSYKQDTIKYITGSVTLEANSYVSPFTYYKEVDLTSTLANKTIIGIVGKTTTTNPITFNYNTNGYLRIYGSKAEVVEFRVSYI